MARAPAPLSVPLIGSYEQRMQILADAISRKADQTAEPVYSAVLLQAPGGATWRLTVTDGGGISLARVPR